MLDEVARLGLIARTLVRQGCLEKADAAFRAALSMAPGHPVLRAEHILLRRETADWAAFDGDHRWLADAVESGAPIPPFAAVLAGLSPALQRRAAECWVQSRGLHSLAPVPRPVLPAAAGPVRIGYLSADFRAHATTWLMGELLRRHDRGRFSVTAYSLGPDVDEPERHEVRAAVDHFVDLHRLDDTDAALRIARDGIDILIDLKGHTAGARPGIVARRPAPVQVAFLGYPGTAGMDALDYLIGDPVVTPGADAAFYQERLVTLPRPYQPNDSRRHRGTLPAARSALGLPEDAVVFAAFNAVAKITPSVFACWMRILRTVPAARLCLLGAGGPAAKRLRQAAEGHGVAPERLTLLPRIDHAGHLARHHVADLFLDCWPYGGHTTAADALWEGLPVLTLCGEGFAARVGASLVRGAGLGELVAEDQEGYERLAIDLARTPGRLAELRRRLRGRSGPLFDVTGYVADYEAALAALWDRHLSGAPPAPLTL